MRKIGGNKSEDLQHPDHSEEIPRLRRIIGQYEAIERMIHERKY